MAEREAMADKKGLYGLLEERLLQEMGVRELVDRVAFGERKCFEECLNAVLRVPYIKRGREFLFTACGFAEFIKEHYVENTFVSFPIEECRIEYEVDFNENGYLNCATEISFVPTREKVYGLTHYKSWINGYPVKDVIDSDLERKIRPLTNTIFVLTLKKYTATNMIGDGDALDMVYNPSK